MIQITCTSCQALLSMDDAFAGGVCRCRHCGAIQTVPRHHKQAVARSRARPTTVAAIAGGGAETRSKGFTPAEMADDAANVASSGLAAEVRRTSAAAPPPPRTKLTLLLIFLAVMLLAAAAAVIWVLRQNR
jgi:hypothetical protein